MKLFGNGFRKKPDIKMEDEEKLELEKGDGWAIAIAAIRVFLPKILIFLAIIYLVTKVFLR